MFLFIYNLIGELTYKTIGNTIIIEGGHIWKKSRKKCNEIVSKEEKLRNEHEAIIKVIGDLVKKNELISLLSEFEERKTREAIFAYHCDKLEADLQSKVYQDMGCHHSLDDQDNNVSCMSIIKL